MEKERARIQIRKRKEDIGETNEYDELEGKNMNNNCLQNK